MEPMTGLYTQTRGVEIKSAVTVVMESMSGEQLLLSMAGVQEGHGSGLLGGCSPTQPMRSTLERATSWNTNVSI